MLWKGLLIVGGILILYLIVTDNKGRVRVVKTEDAPPIVKSRYQKWNEGEPQVTYSSDEVEAHLFGSDHAD